MQAFKYFQPKDVQSAMDLMRRHEKAMFIAGGTNLLDLMKLHVAEPEVLIDINALPLKSMQMRDKKFFIGALALNSDVALNETVRRNYPLLAEALLAGASPQLRNMATVGGNLLQRTRCVYFNDPTFACNKRNPGSGCSALQGWTRQHAVLGTSPHCIATHPSDMAVALNALNADVVIQGPGQERRVPMRSFHLEPGDTPQKETVLNRDELILGVELSEPLKGQTSRYVKVRDRSSYAFALVSAATVLVMDGTTIRESRVALGGVATRPWPATAAEAILKGGRAEDAVFQKAADAAMQGAVPQKMNAFKIDLAKRALRRALQEASSGQRWG